MKKWPAVLVVLIAFIAAAGLYYSLHQASGLMQPAGVTDPKNATYVIGGQSVQLVNGTAETAAAPGSASKIVTSYFGDELNADINGDGKADEVFFLTQNTGGSGTFYYVVAALNTDNEYVGSDGYLLGDRIAPQNIELSQSGGQQNVIIVNYKDRLSTDPMTAQPYIEKSVSLRLDTTTMQWTVEPDSDGTSQE